MSYLIKAWLGGADSNFMPLVEQVVTANELLTVVPHLTGHAVKHQQSQILAVPVCNPYCFRFISFGSCSPFVSCILHPPPHARKAFCKQDLMLTDCFLATIAATNSLLLTSSKSHYINDCILTHLKCLTPACSRKTGKKQEGNSTHIFL